VKGTLLIVLSFLSIACFAQVKTTKVSGKVTDALSGSPLVGASVIIEGSSKGTRTDVEGNFFLNTEVNKSLSLKISSVGYQTKVVSDVQVTDNIAPLTIAMERATGDLNSVVVRTSARKESVASLYVAQKNASAISDGITAEVIRKSPDRNTGEVLKRVSGASVQDNKFVVIRGLSERYNVAMLNNATLPSTEPDKKAFSFDIIPSALVDNLVIYKSATPDLPGDFSGGAIKVSTKDYPSKKLNEVSFTVGYNTLTTFKNFYRGYPDGSLDNLGFFDNKTRLIPAPYYKRRGAAFFNESEEFKRETTKMFPNTYGYEPAMKSAPNFDFSYTGGNTKLIGDNKLGYIYSLNYSEGRRVVERERSEPLSVLDKSPIYQYNTNNYDMRNNLSALVNLSYSYKKSKISWKNLFNNDFVKTIGIRNGVNLDVADQPFYYKSTNTEAMNNGLFNSVFEGMHKLGSSWSVDWEGSYGFTYRNQPDQRILTLRDKYTDPGNYYLSVGYENSPEIRNAGRVYSYLWENIYNGSANATKEFKWLNQTQKFKVGTYNYFRDRNVEVDALGYGILSGYNFEVRGDKETNFKTVLTPENIDKYNLTVANIPSNSTDYKGQALSNAGYAMLDNKFSGKVKLTWGARVERYWQDLKAKNQPEITRDDIDVLPSFILTYALTPKSNFRLAGSQSVNRPEFRELAEYSVYDYENFITVRGNPELVRAKNSNADLRYEFFPSSGEILSASVFYKYFKNPIEQVNKGNDVYSYDNAEHATSLGAEMEIRKRLDFINSGFFSHLTAYANAAYIKGQVKFEGTSFNTPLQGQSPYLINSGLTYSSNNDNFSVNALYNRVGPRLRARAINGAGLNQYEKPRDVIDLQVSKKFWRNRLETKLTVSDLLGQPFSWYYKSEANPSNIGYDAATDFTSNSYKYGTSVKLALKYSFGK
jgi:hypothetical protein